jgi:hypothetical protein
MKVRSTRLVEECVDGLVTKEFDFDCLFTRDYIQRLAPLGKLEYFRFAKPFWRLRTREASLKGIEGSTSCHVVFHQHTQKTEDELLEQLHTIAAPASAAGFPRGLP